MSLSSISLATLSSARVPTNSVTSSSSVSIASEATSSRLFGATTYVKEHLLPNGTIYSGQMKGDIPHGEGSGHFPSGYKFEGQWHEGEPDGPGTLTYRNTQSGKDVHEKWDGGQRTLNSKLFDAIKKGDLESVQNAIKAGAKVNSWNKYSQTPLIEAIYFYKEDMIPFLLNHSSPATINTVAADGYTALIYAFYCTDTKDVASALFEVMCKSEEGVKALCAISNQGGTALSLACSKGWEDLASKIFNTIRKSQEGLKVLWSVTGNGDLPLIFACFQNMKKLASDIFNTMRQSQEVVKAFYAITDNGITALSVTCSKSWEDLDIKKQRKIARELGLQVLTHKNIQSRIQKMLEYAEKNNMEFGNYPARRERLAEKAKKDEID